MRKFTPIKSDKYIAMKLRLSLILLFLIAIRPTVFAESMAFDGIAIDDIKKSKYENARVEISFSETTEQLKLLILPSIEAMHEEALVDTVWKFRSYYREAPTESTDFFEERRIFYLYSLEDDKYLDSYIVFSQFIDKQNKDIKQIVIRKFDEYGHRLWCVSINADTEETNAFFKILQTARKKLKFILLSKVMERPDPQLQHRIKNEDTKMRSKNNMHDSNPYGSGNWH